MLFAPLVFTAAVLQTTTALSMSAQPPKKLAVLGGSGYVGREVCRRAVARGWEVTSLSRRGLNPEPGDAVGGRAAHPSFARTRRGRGGAAASRDAASRGCTLGAHTRDAVVAESAARVARRRITKHARRRWTSCRGRRATRRTRKR